jgi:hypothetical protein
MLSDLKAVGYLDYDDEKRLASLDVIKYRLDQAYENAAEKGEITLSDGIEYVGQLKDGKPNGIGRIFDKSAEEQFPGTVNDMITTACYKDGEVCGMFYTSGTYRRTIGSDANTYKKINYGNTNIGYDVTVSDYHVSSGDCYSVSNVADIVENYDKNGVEFYGITDNEYLYCIANNDIYQYTTYTSGDANITLTQVPSFDSFTGKYRNAMAVSDSGKLYTIPYSETYKAVVDVLFNTDDYDKNIACGNINDNSYAEDDYILTTDGKLYGFDYEYGDNTLNERSVLLADNVQSAIGADCYISYDGTLYEDRRDGNGFTAIDYDVQMVDGASSPIYLKKDGSVWTYRRQAGYEWNDGQDYSTPVKRADDAKYVSCDENGNCLYIKNDGSVWGFGLNYDTENGYIEYDDNAPYQGYERIYSSPHVKLGAEFVSCKADGKVSLALDADGDLYAWGDNSDGIIEKNGEKIISYPIKLAENVRDFIYSGALYIIKKDGTMWYKGETYFNRQHYLSDSFDEFTKCTVAGRKTK